MRKKKKDFLVELAFIVYCAVQVLLSNAVLSVPWRAIQFLWT